MNSNKFRQMEDEMSRFEAEISGTQPVIGTAYQYGLQGFARIPPPPTPPILIPHQISKQMKKSGNYDFLQNSAVVSAKPTMYSTPKQPAPPPPAPPSQAAVDFLKLQNEVEKKLRRLKHEKLTAQLAISQGKASGALQSFAPDYYKRKGSKNLRLMRTAGGQTWEDTTMADWPDDDFRIFCGDLGNDVTDELLFRTFNKYPSFQRAKVIRDRRTNKSKGYGFISFSDPADFTKAIKEMNGRYVGSRPIKLRKSTWRNRCFEVAKRKEKEKATLVNLLTSSGK